MVPALIPASRPWRRDRQWPRTTSPGNLSLRDWAARRGSGPLAAGGGRGTKRACKEAARTAA
eukprot:11740017-Alexandrium_andersonii.AAC.1